jgi:hypothetical protein
MLATLSFTLFAATAVATHAQSDCSVLNPAKGEGKFTGQISTPPDGSSMTVTYAGQSVLVHYGNSVTVCQGGQPASLDALKQGASVSVFGPLRHNGKDMEMDAARIFVAGRPQTVRPSPEPARPNSQQTQPPSPQRMQPPNALSQLPGFQPTQPPTTGLHSIPNSVILGGGTHAETMQRLHVVRAYALSDLRSNSQVTLGAARVNFRPMLNNPRALFNIAQKLRAMPQHVQLKEDSSEISEVEQGLVIHHVLTYRILPGKCNDSGAKAQMAGAGIDCFTRASTGERIAEFSSPGSPRYVADPQKRQAAIAAYQRNSALGSADATKHIADLRKALADPTQRAAIGAQVGQAEAARMSSLSDDQLKEELINSSVQRFEETMFVPRVESTTYLHPQHNLSIAASPAEMAAAKQLLSEGVPERGASPSNYPKLLKVVPNHPLGVTKTPEADKVADVDFGHYIFIDGFTLGQDYEWKWSAETTINWCVVGCSSTYGVYLHAGLGYGLGMRFPIQAQLKYHIVVHANNTAEANVKANFQPIQGSDDDFLSAGIAPDQLFDAKELVAQIGADAGYSVNLPGFGTSHDEQWGVDLTDKLPAPLTNGKFVPPAPGTPGTSAPYIFDSADLLLGFLNYGVVGAQLFPAVDITLFSNKLDFTLNDETLKRTTSVTFNGQTVPLGVSSSAGGDQSHFSFGNPVYNLELALTPGLNPRLFVDLDVWSNHWDWQIWFPQLTLAFPPNGIDFGCHAGTTCVLDFQPVYNASTGQDKDMKKEEDAADNTLTDSGCQRVNGQEEHYLCPVKGILGLCQAMLKNGAVLSCGPLVPTVVDEILKRGHCTGNNANYVCPHDMVGLCGVYLKNREILSCTQAK